MTPLWEPTLGNGLDRAAWEAALAVLLASDEAEYMTGTELTPDGGILAGSAARPAI